MLKIERGKILDYKGREIRLRGIGLGGFLMMEGYILGGRNIPESVFKAKLAKIYGKDFISEFSRRFRDNFIRDEDFFKIKRLGFNCVRLPFNYRLLEEPGGLNYLKKIVGKCGEQKLYVILDMHAVPGSQNPDWHSDSLGKALFWEQEKYRQRYFALWKKIAQTFKNEPWVAGYDIMNEPVTKKVDLLKVVFQQVIDIIRKVGDEHIIFLEGNNYGREVDFLKDLRGENLALSLHFYEPVEFTFNWLPDSKYPGTILGKKWNKTAIKGIFKKYAAFAKTVRMPVFIGEFGIASRCNFCGWEFRWLEDVLDVFEKLGFHWTYWTYKAVKGMDLPDGLFQLSDTEGIIGRKSLVSGMENFYQLLKSRKEEFFLIWQTRNFKLNKFLYQGLKNFLINP